MDRVPEIHKAFDIANQAKLSREEVEDLERREQFIYDQQGAIIKAAQEAREEGRQEGKEEGREEGMREKALAIARQLLARLDNETISQITGLSIEEIGNLRSNEI
jgi:predicted transposase/invertase (TIGR01784 family)